MPATTEVSTARALARDDMSPSRLSMLAAIPPARILHVPSVLGSFRPDWRESASRLLVPAEDAQCAEGVPPARPSLAFVHLDRHSPGVTGPGWPPALTVALRGDQLDR